MRVFVGTLCTIHWKFPTPGSFKPGFCNFYAQALFCALLCRCVRFCALLRTCICARLRSFVCFYVRPRLERPRLGTAEFNTETCNFRVHFRVAVTSIVGPNKANIFKYPQYYSETWPTKTATTSGRFCCLFGSSFSISLSFPLVSPYFQLFHAILERRWYSGRHIYYLNTFIHM